MGQYLTEPNTDKIIEYYSKPERIACSMQGLRQSNEDGHIMIKLNNYLLLCAVFDGHGGDYVSKWLLNNFVRIFIELRIKYKSVEEQLGKTLEYIDIYILEHNDELKQDNDMIKASDKKIATSCGSTAIVCIINTNTKMVYYANIGDSRMIIFSDKIHLKTKLHKTTDPEEMKRLEYANATVKDDYVMVNGQGLAMTRSIGDHLFKQPPRHEVIAKADCGRFSYKDIPGCYIAIACDGVWDYLSSDDVMDQIRKKNLTSSVVKMFDRIIEIEEGSDNITCIVVKLNP